MEMARYRKNKFLSVSGKVNAIVETGVAIYLGEESFQETIRSIGLITGEHRCSKCAQYRPQLRVMYSRYQRKVSEANKFSKERYLNTPQKKKSLRSKVNAANNEIKNLKDKITKLTESEGVNVESEFHKDMLSIMESNNEAIMKQ